MGGDGGGEQSWMDEELDCAEEWADVSKGGPSSEAGKVARNLQALESEYRCEICSSFFESPVSLKCGHTFCSMCIDSHLRAKNGPMKNNCPSCRKPASTNDTKPESKKFRTTIELWKKARPKLLALLKEVAQGDATGSRGGKKKRRRAGESGRRASSDESEQEQVEDAEEGDSDVEVVDDPRAPQEATKRITKPMYNQLKDYQVRELLDKRSIPYSKKDDSREVMIRRHQAFVALHNMSVDGGRKPPKNSELAKQVMAEEKARKRSEARAKSFNRNHKMDQVKETQKPTKQMDKTFNKMTEELKKRREEAKAKAQKAAHAEADAAAGKIIAAVQSEGPGSGGEAPRENVTDFRERLASIRVDVANALSAQPEPCGVCSCEDEKCTAGWRAVWSEKLHATFYFNEDRCWGSFEMPPCMAADLQRKTTAAATSNNSNASSSSCSASSIGAQHGGSSSASSSSASSSSASSSSASSSSASSSSASSSSSSGGGSGSGSVQRTPSKRKSRELAGLSDTNQAGRKDNAPSLVTSNGCVDQVQGAVDTTTRPVRRRRSSLTPGNRDPRCVHGNGSDCADCAAICVQASAPASVSRPPPSPSPSPSSSSSSSLSSSSSSVVAAAAAAASPPPTPSVSSTDSAMDIPLTSTDAAPDSPVAPTATASTATAANFDGSPVDAGLSSDDADGPVIGGADAHHGDYQGDDAVVGGQHAHSPSGDETTDDKAEMVGVPSSSASPSLPLVPSSRSSSPLSSSSETSEESPAMTWSCNLCTYENTDPLSAICVMCRQGKRPPGLIVRTSGRHAGTGKGAGSIFGVGTHGAGGGGGKGGAPSRRGKASKLSMGRKNSGGGGKRQRR